MELKDKLSKDFLLENGIENIKSKFDEIARILLTKTKIVRKPKKKGIIQMEYYITDIEFYLYCDEHPDNITYKRKCDAGEWYLHLSGVDIAFKSENMEFEQETKDKNIKWTKENLFYGGILIRGIETKDEKTLNGKYLNGHPMLVCYELFNKTNMYDSPILEEDDSRLAFGLDKPKKREGISENSKFTTEPYRYTLKR